MRWRFRQEKPKTSEGTEVVLPFDVRYALQYREAKMGVNELHALVDNRLEHESLYLLLKSVSSNPGLQRELLESVAAFFHEHPNPELSPKVFIDFLHNAIQKVPQTVQVPGEKLAQLSRQGFDTWHEWYKERAEMYARDSVRKTFLLAHATLVGFAWFSRKFHAANRDFFILVPDQINNNECETCGYSIKPNQQVIFLKKDFIRERAVIVDDMERTGETVNQILSFWNQDIHTLSPDVDVIGKNDNVV